jgi:hypothetical protein
MNQVSGQSVAEVDGRAHLPAFAQPFAPWQTRLGTRETPPSPPCQGRAPDFARHPKRVPDSRPTPKQRRRVANPHHRNRHDPTAFGRVRISA